MSSLSVLHRSWMFLVVFFYINRINVRQTCQNPTGLELIGFIACRKKYTAPRALRACPGTNHSGLPPPQIMGCRMMSWGSVYIWTLERNFGDCAGPAVRLPSQVVNTFFSLELLPSQMGIETSDWWLIHDISHWCHVFRFHRFAQTELFQQNMIATSTFTVSALGNGCTSWPLPCKMKNDNPARVCWVFATGELVKIEKSSIIAYYRLLMILNDYYRW